MRKKYKELSSSYSIVGMYIKPMSALRYIFLIVFISLTNHAMLFGQIPIFDWAIAAGDTGQDATNSLALDLNGFIYTTGYFTGNVDFDPGSGVLNFTSTDWEDMYIQKLDIDGSLIWAKHIASSIGGVYGVSIVVDSLKNIYLTGDLWGIADFDPDTGVTDVTSKGNLADVFFQKLDSLGKLIWVKQIHGTSGPNINYLNSRNIKLSPSGNLVAAGLFSGNVDFDPDVDSLIISSLGWDDNYIIKLDTQGNLIWVRTYGGTFFDQLNDMKLDESGNIYTTGYFYETVNFNPWAGSDYLTAFGLHDIYILKLDSNGLFEWVRQIGGLEGEQALSIAIDKHDNVYTTGHFRGVTDFNPGTATTYLTPNGPTDIFILKLDKNGSFKWVKQIGGKANDGGTSIKTDTFGNVYVTGTFGDSVDFDPGLGVVNLVANGSDAYILKLDSTGQFVWVNQFKSTQSVIPTSLELDIAFNLCLAGVFSGSVDFDPSIGVTNITSNGSFDMFTQKMSPSTMNTIEYSMTSTMDVYPNPSAGHVTIQLANFNDISGIRLYSSSGKLIWKDESVKTPILEIELNIPDGTYVLEVSSSKNILYQRIIINQ